jgi:hypothetical protein
LSLKYWLEFNVQLRFLGVTSFGSFPAFCKHCRCHLQGECKWLGLLTSRWQMGFVPSIRSGTSQLPPPASSIWGAGNSLPFNIHPEGGNRSVFRNVGKLSTFDAINYRKPVLHIYAPISCISTLLQSRANISNNFVLEL